MVGAIASAGAMGAKVGIGAVGAVGAIVVMAADAGVIGAGLKGAG